MAFTATLVLVAGLVGLLAAVLILLMRGLLRANRRPPARPGHSPLFRLMH